MKNLYSNNPYSSLPAVNPSSLVGSIREKIQHVEKNLSKMEKLNVRTKQLESDPRKLKTSGASKKEQSEIHNISGTISVESTPRRSQYIL